MTDVISGTLYMIATPIGNLGDISARAIETLKSVSRIAAEDTRVTKTLLTRYDIDTPASSLHAHTNPSKIDRLLDDVTDGKDLAYVSDAGTPAISDPGGMLVERAHARDIRVIPIPGPSAVTALLSVAGLPADQFIFLGFFPRKKGRQTALKELAETKMTTIFYESPHRIAKTVQALGEVLEPNRHIVIGRELTKKFEEVVRGPISKFVHDLTVNPKGEFVVAVAGKGKKK